MSDPAPPEGLQIVRTRVYFDTGSGHVVHLHQLVSAPGEDLTEEWTEAEMAVLEDALRQRLGEIDYLVVTADELAAAGEGARVDVARRRLVPRTS
jgi:hypothetical protein